MRAIFCIDPGIRTGVAWGIVDETAETAVEAMANRLFSDSETVHDDNPVRQAKILWLWWENFKRDSVYAHCMDPDAVNLVVEDFILRGGQHAGGKDGTAPERIAWAFEGYRHGRFDTHRKEKHLTPITWQAPSAAARFAKRPILESCGAWVRGREHERSAFSHMILRLNKLMDETPRRRR